MTTYEELLKQKEIVRRLREEIKTLEEERLEITKQYNLVSNCKKGNYKYITQTDNNGVIYFEVQE